MTLRNERSNSILMTYHFPDLGSGSDWYSRVGNLLQPMTSITQIWVVTRHQYGISLLVHQASFRGETNVGVVKCRLFSEAVVWTNRLIVSSVCRVPDVGAAAAGSIPCLTNTQDLKNTLGEGAAFVSHLQVVRSVSVLGLTRKTVDPVVQCSYVLFIWPCGRKKMEH